MEDAEDVYEVGDLRPESTGGGAAAFEMEILGESEVFEAARRPLYYA